VALVIETTRTYGRRIIEGVASYVRENEPWLLHVEPRALFDLAPRWLARWQGDGIIARVVDAKSAKLLRDTGVPVVNVKASADTCLEPPLVANDQPAIGRLAAEHLLERGFRRFAFVGATGYSWSDGRLEGFQSAIEQAGCPCEQLPKSSQMLRRYRDGLVGEEIQKVAAWLGQLPKPLGVLAADDFLGLELLNACRSSQIAVPEEVAVVGVDNETAICEFSYPPLTSIVPDNVRLGREAAALLDHLMRGKSLPKRQLKIPPKGIVVRQSTDVIAIDDPVVAEAMSYIRETACLGIQVNDVVRQAGVSPATLQRRFHQWMDCSVYDAILNTRLARAKRLLTDTELPLKAIAARCGFKHVEHLCAIFKQKVGRTMKEFRSWEATRDSG
jgi:LacI family transcriptional regulator